jgi:hypothetical protein
LLETPKAFWYTVCDSQLQCKNPGDETMDNQQERLELSPQWFAGFFEAEGWLSLMDTKRVEKGERISRYVPTCGICNTDFHILSLIHDLFYQNGIEYQSYVRKPRKKGYKLSWQIHISGMKKCIKFIEFITPHMIGEKKIKAQKILEFCINRKNKINGFCGVSYSQSDIELFCNINSKILNDYTPNTEKVMI